MQGNVGLELSVETQPASKCIPVDRCFPDLSAGENIQDGEFFFELDLTNAKGVRDMKVLDGYIAQQIKVGFKKGAIKPLGNSDWKLDRITFWEM